MNLWGQFRAGQGANTKRFLRPRWKSLKSLFAGRRRWGSTGHWWCWTGKHLLPYWPIPSGTWTPGPSPPSSGYLQPLIFLLFPAKGSSGRSLWSPDYRKGIKVFTSPGEELRHWTARAPLCVPSIPNQRTCKLLHVCLSSGPRPHHARSFPPEMCRCAGSLWVSFLGQSQSPWPWGIHQLSALGCCWNLDVDLEKVWG